MRLPMNRSFLFALGLALIAPATLAQTAGKLDPGSEEQVVQRDAPVIPVTYSSGWALARDGLLGAGQNGLGNLRMAGLAWAD